MRAIIHFTSGKQLEIDEREFRQIAPKLQHGGVRLYRTGNGSLIPLNSNTMELIEVIKDEETEYVNEPVGENKTLVVKPETQSKSVLAEPEAKAEGPVDETDRVEPKAPKETDEQKAQKALARMIELSNCKHEKQIINVQQTKSGVRYFPVCTKCGKRERYVSEARIRKGEDNVWTPEDLDNATPWIER